MRSVTSCFNSTLYRKSMTRFWPLWALYTVIWAFCMPMAMLNRYFSGPVDPAQMQTRLLNSCLRIPGLLTFGVGLAMVMAALCAMAVFGYLYSSRSASMMHALPMKRDTLFLTQYLAGLSFLLLPNLAVAGVTAVVELVLLPSGSWGTALQALLIWLVAQSLVCLFFFSFASLCAMLTGHTLALPAFYGIFNVLVLIMVSLVKLLASEFFYGIPSDIGDSAITRFLTPLWALIQACRYTTTVTYVDGIEYNVITDTAIDSLPTVAVYGLVGLVMAAVALLLYRRRHIETAGDVVAIPLIRPVFLAGVAFCTGLCLGWATTMFFNWEGRLPLIVWVLIWTVVGWFAAKMLLAKSFRVFHAWKGCVAMVAVMAALCLLLMNDFLGIETRVPDAGDVKSVTVYSGIGAYPYDGAAIRGITLTGKEQIEEITALHQALVDTRDTQGYHQDAYEAASEHMSFQVDYLLDNNTHLVRQYSFPVYLADLNKEGTPTWCANQIIQDRDLVYQCYGFDQYKNARPISGTLERVWCSSTSSWESVYLDNVTNADLTRLWEAVQQDFAEGTIGVRYLIEDAERLKNTCATDLYLTFESGSSSQYLSYLSDFSITLTPNAAHTLAWIEEMGVLEEGMVIKPHSALSETEEYAYPALID